MKGKNERFVLPFAYKLYHRGNQEHRKGGLYLEMNAS